MGELKHPLCLSLLVSLFGLRLTFPLWPGEPPQDGADWENLKQLVSGQQIQIVLDDAKSFQGKFRSVSDEVLVVRLASGEQTFNRKGIARVSAKRQGHRRRNSVLGAAIGFGVGAGIGAGAGNSSAIGGRGTTALVGAAIGLPIGAATGALLPRGGWQDVYRAR